MRAATLLLCLATGLVAACDAPSAVTDPPLDPTLDADLQRVLGTYGVVPIGPVQQRAPALVTLGQALFFDRVLSGNRDIACATCHHPDLHGGDGRALPVGTGGTGLGPDRVPGSGRELVPRNAPSMLNQGLRPFYLLWDGRLSGHGAGPFQTTPDLTLPQGLTDILAAQSLLPVLDRREMRGENGDVDVFGDPNELAALSDEDRQEIWHALMARLTAIPEYQELFAAAFPGVSPAGLRFTHAATALSAFITTAFTKATSPFDRYLAGDVAALTNDAKRGALLFFGARALAAESDDGIGDPAFRPAPCSGCHGGPLLGGQTFANVGAPQIGPGVGSARPLDLGRGGVDFGFGDSQDFYRFFFRAPALRNVELTSPYMHSGAYATLEEVVRHYSDPEEGLRGYDPSTLDPALQGLVHDDPATLEDVASRIDPFLREGFDFTDDEVAELVAFLRALTDPAARDLSGLVPVRVPSGLPVD